MDNKKRIDQAIALLFRLRDEMTEEQARDISELDRLLS